MNLAEELDTGTDQHASPASLGALPVPQERIALSVPVEFSSPIQVLLAELAQQLIITIQ